MAPPLCRPKYLISADNPGPIGTTPVAHGAVRQAGSRAPCRRSRTAPAKRPRTLIRLVTRAHRFHDLLVKHKGGKFGDLAKSEKLNRSYFSQLLRLDYLGPDLNTQLLARNHAHGLT